MENNNRFAMMLEALTELIDEEKVPSISSPVSETQTGSSTHSIPTLNTLLTDISPLPPEALFLGMAEDGLPVLMNLYDPVPGPILIAGDAASGKTALLKTIASAAEILHPSDRVQYGIITPRPDEWKNFYQNGSNAGIFRSTDDNTRELLESLVTWAHRNKGSEQSVLLLIDDLDTLSKLDESTQQHLRWLLLRGPNRRVWTFVTVQSTQARELSEWLDFFHTRLFGRVEDPEHVYYLTGSHDDHLDDLASGNEFAMREGKKLLRFVIPSIE